MSTILKLYHPVDVALDIGLMEGSQPSRIRQVGRHRLSAQRNILIKTRKEREVRIEANSKTLFGTYNLVSFKS